MKYLLDTHLLLWAALADNRLPVTVVHILSNPESIPHFSVASIWETAIKQSLGRADFQVDAGMLRAGLLTAGYEELPIESRHVLEVRSLPHLHRDPFDRLLVAQARVEGMMLLTSDNDIRRYEGPIRGV